MEEKFCQSCGMPMSAPGAEYGTEADGSKSADYCSYCYENGAFKADCTMEEMIEFCVPHMAEAGSGISPDEARERMRQWFPTLKRWKQK